MSEGKSATVPLSPELADAIEAQLDYGDSRAEWIREACRRRLREDPATTDSRDDVPAEN